MTSEIKEKILETLRDGGLVVLPTDTTYGIVASALDPEATKRLSGLRRKDASKLFITLIADRDELEKFDIFPTQAQRGVLEKYWPGPVSVVISGRAFRVPDSKILQELLGKAGPLLAPSANPPGSPTALTVEKAREYFGENVDLYVDGGIIDRPPSTLIHLRDDGSFDVLRSGGGKV